MSSFEPKLVGFLCNWCSYAGADLAGVSRMEYPPNVRIIRVMCSARTDPMLVMKAFNEGADGVLVAGCHPGDCHYVEGNYYTRRRYAVVKEMMKNVGIEPQRFRVEWVSASEGKKFQDLITQIVSDLKKLGPLNLMEGKKDE